MRDGKITIIHCDCGVGGIEVEIFDLEEKAAGVWGPLRCPECKTKLNDKFEERLQEINKLKEKSS